MSLNNNGTTDLTNPLRVLCVLTDTSGFGDVVFLIKFVKYILKSYGQNVGVQVVVGKTKVEFVASCFTDKELVGSYSEYTSALSMTSRLIIHTGARIISKQLRLDYTLNGDVLFIVPKTNFAINLDYEDPVAIQNNSYVLSEYNPMLRQKNTTIYTGVQDESGVLSGFFLNNTRLPFVDLRTVKKYSILYIYTDDESIKEFVVYPTRIRF